MAQTELRFFPRADSNYLNVPPDLDCNSKHGAYNFYHFFTKKKEKIRCVRFPPKAVTVCFGEEERFDCKNNHGCGKSPNFRLDNISKFNN